jgi:hypothetical protein
MERGGTRLVVTAHVLPREDEAPNDMTLRGAPATSRYCLTTPSSRAAGSPFHSVCAPATMSRTQGGARRLCA